MLKYLVLAVAFLYLLFLIYLKFYREPKSQKVLLIIKKNVSVKNLEWFFYSFNRFISKNLCALEWWVYVEDNQERSPKNRAIRSLSRRFNYKIVERHYRNQDYVYIFNVDAKSKEEDWEQTLSNYCNAG